MKRKKEANPCDWSQIVAHLRYLEKHGHELDPALLLKLPEEYKKALNAARRPALAKAIAALKALQQEPSD